MNMFARFEGFLGSIASAVTVEHFMTPNGELFTCTPQDDPTVVLGHMEEQNYTIAPFREGNRIIGFVRRERLAESAKLDDVHEPIQLEHLIASTTPLMRFLELLTPDPSRFFFVFHEQEVIGLVTAADLNKSPFRTWLYILFAEFETALFEQVRHIPWREYLSPVKLQELEETAASARKGDVDHPLESYLTLADLVNITVKHKPLCSRLGFPSRNQAEDVLNPLVQMRNGVMHPIRPVLVLDARDSLPKLVERVNWLNRLTQCLRSSPVSKTSGVGNREGDMS